MSGSKFVCAFLSLLLCFSFTPTSVFAQDTVAETSPNLSESTGAPASPDEVAGSAEADEPTEPPLPTAPEQPISPVDGALDDSGADEKSYESVEAEDEPTSVSEAQELIQPQNDLAGSGTEADPFLVGSVEDLELLRGIMNGNPGVHVKMTSDISVGEWEPFYPSSGYITEAFSGVFDGCGHSITNLGVNRTTTNVGFFGGINGATIKNLHVSGTVSSTKAYVGGIVGKVQQGSLTGCSFSGSVSTGAKGSTAYAGGLVGYAGNSASQTASFSNCSNTGSVSGGVAGGIVGYAKYTTIESSYNTGSVTGTSRAGGICGQLQNNGSVERCYSTGTISGSDTASDIVDFLYGSSTIKTCGYVTRISGAGTGTVDEESCVQSDDPAYLHSVIIGGTAPGPVDPDDPDPTPGPSPDEPNPDVPPATDKTLDEIAASLSTLYPEFGKDANVVDMIHAKHPNITVALKSIEKTNGTDNCSAIDQEGNITYFYADPDGFRAQWFGSYRITIDLSLAGATVQKTVPVIVYWNAQKVKAMLAADVLSQVDLGDTTNVSTDLSLPKVASGKLWAQITWTSSDPSVISVSSENQGTADTLFAPYVGKVKCGETPKDVTLTAKVVFQRTAMGEPEIAVEQTFPVHVDSLDGARAQQIKSELMAKLDAGFAKAGLRDSVTGVRLQPDAGGIYTVENDIQLPTTADFGVDGKYYPVTLASSDGTLLTVPDVRNSARVSVLRPMGTGSLARSANMEGLVALSVSLSDKDTGVKATKDFTIRVKPIELSDLASEFDLMEQVKQHYFDGLNAGANPSANEVTVNLSPFFEVYADDNGELVWVRDSAQEKNTGIVPVAQDGWEELELWRLFKSSNAKVVSHENLLVTRQAEPKAVTIKSVLSHKVYGKYGKLYAEDPITYAQYKDLAALYNQEVSAEILVRGTSNPLMAMARRAPVDVNFAVTDGSRVLYSGKYKQLPEGTTAWDVFKQMVPAGNYQHKGSYVSSITGPDGTVLAEKSRGPNSGWLYSVNGTTPSVGLAGYTLEDGDKLVLFFTDDGSAYGHWEWPSVDGSPSEGSQGSGTSSPAPEGSQGSGTSSTAPEGSQGSGTSSTEQPGYEPDTPDAFELVNWVKAPGVKEGDQVLITSSDGTSRIAQPLVVFEDAYVPLASGESYEIVEADLETAEAEWWHFYLVVLIIAIIGIGTTAVVRLWKKGERS